MTPRSVAAILASAWALAVPSATAGDAPKDPFELVGAFGPENTEFPWACGFSPDGRWAGFTEGYTRYVEVWDVAAAKRAWPPASEAQERLAATHRVAFTADSRRMAFVANSEIQVLVRDGDAWSVERKIPLGFWPGIYESFAPWRLDFTQDAAAAVLSGNLGAWRVDLASGRVESLSGDAKDVCATFVLPGDVVAYSRSKAFVTRLLPPNGEPKEIPGVLLETSPDGKRWLIATDPKRFDLDSLPGNADAHLLVEIRDAAAGRALATFELAGHKKAGDSYGHRLLLQGRFSPDGRWLATVEGTGEIVIRDAATGVPVQRITEYAKLPYPMGVAFSPDSARMLTGGGRPFGEGLPHILLWKRR